MADKLESPKLMLENAKLHIQKFHTEHKSFFDSNPFGMINERNESKNEILYKVTLVKTPPKHWYGLINNAIQDLRATLDQLVFASISGQSGKNTYFPFAKSKNEVSKRLIKDCKGVPPSITDIYESSKPYPGGDDILWCLNELSNSQKHREFTATLPQWLNINPTYAVIGPGTEMFSPPIWIQKKGELILARSTLNGGFQYNYSIDFFIAFTKLESLKYLPIGYVLDHLYETIQNIINQVEAEGIRIGIF